MAGNEVVVKASKVNKWKKFQRYAKIALLLLLLILIIFYLVLRVLFDDGSFVVSLEDTDMLYSGLTMYETLNDPTSKRKLKAEDLQFMDNISIKWLPDDITEYEGSHNGKNYIAYSFYIENQGRQKFNYWYYITMDDVIKHADEALRIMIYINDDKTIYAKGNSIDGEAEPGTVKFRDDEDGTIILEQRADMKPDDLDKITVVVWIEGDDPECTNALLGGHARLHMMIREEHDEDSMKDWSDTDGKQK